MGGTMDYRSAAALIESTIQVLTQAGYRVERLGHDLWRVTHVGTVHIWLTAQLLDRAERIAQAADAPAVP